MKDHRWFVEVCVDLRNYADTHGLTHLETAMKAALSAARLEVVLLAASSSGAGDEASDASNHDESNVIPLRARR